MNCTYAVYIFSIYLTLKLKKSVWVNDTNTEHCTINCDVNFHHLRCQTCQFCRLIFLNSMSQVLVITQLM